MFLEKFNFCTGDLKYTFNTIKKEYIKRIYDSFASISLSKSQKIIYQVEFFFRNDIF